MGKVLNPDDSVERLPLKAFTERAYLDYSMYVILDRALPHIADGLKPVQRRIVYAMSELGLSTSAKYKKSARTVGDVLGKYHPHGDSACYEAMVLMAQPFSYRYPLVDGQGNWGSSDDPKSFAAMRYTEARLAPFAQTLLAELGQGTVDWVPNFDGTLNEPALLPARLPQVLLNGASGIAVGMATDIPPHNLREVTSACVALLDDPAISIAQLCRYIQGPDFPTGGELVTAPQDIERIYLTGGGSLRLRASYERDGTDVIITALPYQVSGARVLEQIASQMQARKLPMVDDLRDESDHENPVRLVLSLRSTRVDVDPLLNHLFATTDLEKSYRVNLNMIGLDKRPRVKDLKQILGEWLHYRTETVRRRLRYRLERVERRLHIVAGLLIAYLDLDEVIRIVRFEDDPRTRLMERFRLTEDQADAILETRLRHLARLEEMKLKAEQNELSQEQTELQALLGSDAKLRALIRTELQADADNYGDDRRTHLVVREPAQALDETALTPSEPITVALSEKGWVRAAKGHEVDTAKLNYKAGDGFLSEARGRSNQNAVFLDCTGRSYTLAAHTLASARGYGEPLTSRLSPPPGSQFISVLLGHSDELWLLASSAGFGFVCRLKDMLSRNKAGKALLMLPRGSRPLAPVPVSDLDHSDVVAITSLGYLLRFPLSQLPQLAKGKGNKIIGIPSRKLASGEETLAHLACLAPDAGVILHCGKRQLTLKPADLKSYYGERGRRGHRLPRGLQRVDRLLTTGPTALDLPLSRSDR